MKQAIVAALILQICLTADAAEAEGFDHSHRLFTEILARYSSNGRVDYRGLRANRAKLDSYVSQLGAVGRSDYRNWTRPQKLAYWINAYNAFAIQTIIDNYPIRSGQTFKGKFYPDNSIQQIPGVWDDITHKTAEGQISLNHIEHKILRKELQESRIHFCIVCASIGCPQLWNQAFEAANLETQLEAAADRFVGDPVNVRVDLREEAIYLSKIFKWFHEDFERFARLGRYGKYDGVVSFCLNYLPKAFHRQLTSTRMDIEWIDYDWTLNEQ